MKKRLTQVIVSILLVETVLFGAPIQAGLAVSSSSDNNQADVAPIFFDVPYSYWAWIWIETLYRNGVTAGCSTNPPMYCPEDAVTRAQMAVFLERGVHGSEYQRALRQAQGKLCQKWRDNWEAPPIPPPRGRERTPPGPAP